jgi:hypothetical protein
VWYEGALATALLVAGGTQSLSALQSASIVFGLPFNLFLFAMMYCTVKMCVVSEEQNAAGNYHGKMPDPEETAFVVPLFGGIFNIVEYVASLGKVHPARVEKGMDLPKASHFVEFMVGLFIPPASVFRITAALEYGRMSQLIFTGIYAVFFYTWIALFACFGINFGFVAFAFIAFFLCGCMLSVLRMEIRDMYDLEGNVVADFLMSSFFFPQVFCQLIHQIMETPPENDYVAEPENEYAPEPQQLEEEVIA